MPTDLTRTVPDMLRDGYTVRDVRLLGNGQARVAYDGHEYHPDPAWGAASGFAIGHPVTRLMVVRAL